MIIWSGLGFLVAVIVFGFSLALNFAFNAWWSEGYYDTHKWPFAISLFLSAITCWFLGSSLRKRKSQIVIDKETGKELVLNRSNHTLFLIPVHIWAPILAVIGGVVLVIDLMK
jgi:hypothetical protein